MARVNQSSVVGRQKISFIDSPHTPHPTPYTLHPAPHFPTSPLPTSHSYPLLPMTVFEGNFTEDISSLRFAIVIGRFNDLVTDKLLSGCQDCLKRHGVDVNPDSLTAFSTCS